MNAGPAFFPVEICRFKSDFTLGRSVSAISFPPRASLGKMTAAIEKSTNFRIEALLAHGAQQRGGAERAAAGLLLRSPGGGGPSTPNPKARNPSSVPRDGPRLHLSQAGIAALHHGGLLGMRPGCACPLAALGGQTHGLVCPGFAQLLQLHLQPPPEPLESAAVAAGLPLERWIRAGECGGK